VANSRIDNFEAEPRVARDPRAMLLTRVWAPGPGGEDAEHRKAINDQRAECVRLLRAELGPRFTGGLAPSPLALEQYRECVAPEAVTRKRAFLSLVKQHDVCVASMGLRGSNGWRLAEYVAASRAIATEELQRAVPGGFGSPTNYAEFRSPEDCVAAVVALMEDSERRLRMMEANQAYYRYWVRPDAIVRRSLEAADVLPPF
jgi:hypothetical protein